MAKIVAERKVKQRKWQRKSDVAKIDLFLDEQELEMRQRNCALRRLEESLMLSVNIFRC
ncbi:TPA: hypothetical protein ACQFXC_001618 [Proteus mirabilis]|uniref:hypothetical protein n=1 Tax=Proteus mirabilis TaxID=584 RepID=UPI0003FCD364|nr:hypothetical protein [Proteus mirabilis]AZF93137.1 MAG: hypothetical protein [Phage NG55]